MNTHSEVVVPMYEFGDDGSLLPNPLFHRSWDRLHSRCIEYPFAASQLGNAKKILDVGTVKSDPAWIRWLESLPVEVHAVDYDFPKSNYRSVKFLQADLRKMPFIDNTFEKVLAISVVEHIGMVDPQVVAETLPEHEEEGDLRAVQEIMRVLKPSGELVMTLPFGKSEKLVADNSARIYTPRTIKKFERHATLISLDYYEYQYSKYQNLYREFDPEKRKREKLKDIFFENKQESLIPIHNNHWPKHFGVVTWRKVPLESTDATHDWHADGVVCGVWRKE